MSADRQEVKLSEIADFQNGYAFNSREYVPKSPESKEVLRMGYIQRGGGFKEDDKPVYAPLSSKGSDTRYCLEEGDIVIAMTDMKDRVAILANCAQIPSSGRFLLNQRVGRIRTKDRELADQKYLYYFMNSSPQVQHLRSMANRGVQVNLTTSAIVDSLVSLPSVIEQRNIAHILGTLDDKIELNRKTNETLEGIAKALFKSWFVVFDPVRAKAEGRPNGLPDEISELFPDSFEESELGEIPSGWNVGEVQDLCEWVSSGGTPSRSKKEFWEDGDIPWFKTGELNDGPLLNSVEKINELAVNNSACKLWEKGTILFAIYASPTVGRLGVLTSRGTSNQAAAGLMASKSIGTPFLRRCLLFSRDELQNIAVGAAQQNINVKILKEHKIVIPPETLAGRFSGLVNAFDDRQEIVLKEVSSLEQLRDALLPRLISGELRVPDAEKMLEEVGI